MSIRIKDVDQNAFRNLKAEAMKAGLKVGDAATEAFRMWIASKRQKEIRDEGRMQDASKDMDELRRKHRIKWSGADEIRKWRDTRK